MNQVNLNKKSVKQQGGASMMQPMIQPQQQVDPAIQQISQFFAEAIEQGGQPEEIIINLMQQEVDQNTIAQALITVGYQEADITALFESVQQPFSFSKVAITWDAFAVATHGSLPESLAGLIQGVIEPNFTVTG